MDIIRVLGKRVMYASRISELSVVRTISMGYVINSIRKQNKSYINEKLNVDGVVSLIKFSGQVNAYTFSGRRL